MTTIILAMKGKFPRGVQKYIRREKARIRREFFDVKDREERIQDVYKKFDYMVAGKEAQKS